MSSTYKTNYLGLNKFVGTDKPKMEDFNFDNEQLDSKFQEHVESNLHITKEERKLLGKSNFVMGSYVGDGQEERIIPLDNEVEFLFIFTAGEALNHVNGTITDIFSAVLTPLGCTAGASLTEGGFSVSQFPSSISPMDGNKALLNQSGKTYLYLAIPKAEQAG